MTIAGFTGTQEGMTEKQTAQLGRVLIEERVSTLHHGDCVGADAQAHELALHFGIQVVIHPPDDPRKRAWCEGDVIKTIRPYLMRNHDIIDETQILIAAPKSYEEELRSGTWATVRYARKQGKRIRMLWP